jgi:hypothetical protein
MRSERFFNWVFDNESRRNGVDKRVFIDEEHKVYKEVTTYYNTITGEVFNSKMKVVFRVGPQEFLSEKDLFNFLFPV